MLTIAKSGKSKKDLGILLEMLNKHCLITGSTGSGKTVSLAVLIEGISKAGVPVFAVDAKGDLSGLARPGDPEKIRKQVKALGLPSYTFQNFPTTFFDVYGELGHPINTSIERMGPVLGKLLSLSEVQMGTLLQVMKIASDHNWKLITIADLKTVISYTLENAKELEHEYGRLAIASIGSISRAILGIESEGGQNLFGTPVELSDLMKVVSGYGMINILAAEKLLRHPTSYAAVMLSLINLLEELPEVGDGQLKLVICIDECHLLFDGMPNVLLNKYAQLIRLVRSKGVGLVMVTQSPSDIPDQILAQCNNKIQHKLNYFTPKEAAAVRSASRGLRPNPEFSTESEIGSLKTGEALISMLNSDGQPMPVEKALIYPPHSRIGVITNEERQEIINKSPLLKKYNAKANVDKKNLSDIIKREQPVQEYPNKKEKECIPLGVQLFQSLIKSGSSKGLMGKLLKMM